MTIISTLQKITRGSVGLLAVGMLVGLAAPAAADTPAQPVSTAAGANPLAANFTAIPTVDDAACTPGDADPECVKPGTPEMTLEGNESAGATAHHHPKETSKAGKRNERRHDRIARKLVNDARAKAGCPPLQISTRLMGPTVQQSADQAKRDRLGHDGANGSTSNSRLSGLGYSRWGENVAQYQSAELAVAGWMNSAGHRANIQNCTFKETYLDSSTSSSGKIYWTQTFGG